MIDRRDGDIYPRCSVPSSRSVRYFAVGTVGTEVAVSHVVGENEHEIQAVSFAKPVETDAEKDEAKALHEKARRFIREFLSHWLRCSGRDGGFGRET